MSSPALRGAGRWLLAPSTIGQVFGASLATYYGILTLQLPPGAVPYFVGVAAVVVVALTVYGDTLAFLRVRTLRALGRGALPASKEHLARALGEVARLPDFMFFLGVKNWLLGASGVALGVRLFVDGVDLPLMLRIAALGILFGPLSSMLVFLLVTLRARRLIGDLAQLGLSPREVIEALPPRRLQLRTRLVAFTAISVILPAIMVADVASTLSRRSIERVIAAPRDDQHALAEQERDRAIGQIALLCGLVLALALVTAYAGGTALGRPMRDIADEATRIARGDLGQVKVIPAEDEVWALSSSFTTMQAHLSEVLSQLKAASLRIGATTEEIVATSQHYEAGAATQASALNETSATTEELARSARQIAEGGESVAQLAQRTLAAAEEGRGSSDAFSRSMSRIRQDNQAISQSVVKLNKRVKQIGKIVEFINGIAQKADLLALSADLEGHKAGEVGRGFSLVASEMRRLAENVLESTREIEGLIDEIRDATAAAVVATDEGVKATEAGATLADSVSDSLRRIVEAAGRTSDAIRAISLATQQQQTGTDQLAEAMADILRVTQQGLTATKEVTSANLDLSALSQDLKSVVDRFRFG